jgi:hypothetical protein
MQHLQNNRSDISRIRKIIVFGRLLYSKINAFENDSLYSKYFVKKYGLIYRTCELSLYKKQHTRKHDLKVIT